MRRYLPVLFPLVLAGCVIWPSPARVAALNALVGQNETELVRQLGVPTRSFTTGGHTFLAYDERRVDVVPGWQPYPYGPFGWGWGWGWSGGGFPPQAVTYTCETTFELNGNIVASWTLRGNAC
jgi:hypothetical protein